MSIVLAGDLVCQFWVLTAVICGLGMAGEAGPLIPVGCGLHILFVYSHLLSCCSFWNLCFWCLGALVYLTLAWRFCSHAWHAVGDMASGLNQSQTCLGLWSGQESHSLPSLGREAESLLLLLLVCGDRRVALGALSVPQGVSCHPFHPHPPSGLLIPLKKKLG